MAIYILLFIQSIVASGTHIIAKIVVNDVEPVTLTMLRSSMAAAALVLIVVLRKAKLRFERGDLKLALWLSLLAIPVNQFLFLTAIHYTTAANAALMYGTTPAMVLVLSALMGRERVTPRKSTGIVVAFLGILIVMFERGIDFHSEYTFGNILLLFAVISWGLYTVQGQRLIYRYGPFSISSFTMIAGALLFIPVGLMPVIHYDFTQLTLFHWGGLLYLSLGTSILAYYLWYYALARAEASKVAVFANLQPVITTLLSVLILGQDITPAFIIGGIVALAGVITTQTA